MRKRIKIIFMKWPGLLYLCFKMFSPQPSRVTQYNNRQCLTQITFSNSEPMNDPLITIYYLLCHKVVLPVLLTKLQIILQQNLIFAAAMPPLNQAVSTRK